jgi:hypothetical protein
MSNQSESWAKGDAAIDANNLLWKQYGVFVDLFRFYLDTMLKANIWFYSITGAILTYYFKNAQDPLLKYSLVLPMILGLGFGIMCLYGSIQANDTRKKLIYIRDELKLPGMPHVQILFYFLIFAGILFIVVAAAIYFFVFRVKS